MWAPGRFGVQNGRIQGLELGTATASIKSAKSVESMRHFAPGLIDLHVHGFGGWGPVGPMDEFRERGEGEHSSLERMAAALARAGTTAFLPTLFPEAPAALNQTVQRTWRDAIEGNQATHADRPRGAQVLGLHLEGPFVNPMAAGALPLADLAEPSVAALRTLLAGVDAAAIRTLTLAPELAGATDLVRELTTMGLRVSFGHSRAQAADVRALLQRYPSTAFGITHLFNAMSGVHHREPGLAHLALCDDSVYAEMIGDLVHVGREGFELALRARGPEHLCIVSDALAGAGTGCDVFHSHGRKHVIRWRRVLPGVCASSAWRFAIHGPRFGRTPPHRPQVRAASIRRSTRRFRDRAMGSDSAPRRTRHRCARRRADHGDSRAGPRSPIGERAWRPDRRRCRGRAGDRHERQAAAPL